MVELEDSANTSASLRYRGLQETAAADNVCLANHTGPFCFKCVPGTVKRSALRVCQECTESDYETDRGRIAGIFIACGVVLLVIIFATYVFTYRSYLMTLGKAKTRQIELRAREIYAALGKYKILHPS
jgi:hypothetical protein